MGGKVPGALLSLEYELARSWTRVGGIKGKLSAPALTLDWTARDRASAVAPSRFGQQPCATLPSWLALRVPGRVGWVAGW